VLDSQTATRFARGLFAAFGINEERILSTVFWIKRFLTVLVGAFVIIGAAQLIKSKDIPYALTQGAIWSVISASVFTVARIFQSRRGQHCAVCKDTPEMQPTDLNSSQNAEPSAQSATRSKQRAP
jgi:hypothetical protein